MPAGGRLRRNRAWRADALRLERGQDCIVQDVGSNRRGFALKGVHRSAFRGHSPARRYDEHNRQQRVSHDRAPVFGVNAYLTGMKHRMTGKVSSPLGLAESMSGRGGVSGVGTRTSHQWHDSGISARSSGFGDCPLVRLRRTQEAQLPALLRREERGRDSARPQSALVGKWHLCCGFPGRRGRARETSPTRRRRK